MKKLALILTVGIVMFACNPTGFDVVPNDLNQDGITDTFTITLANGIQKVVCNSTTYPLNAGNTFVNNGFVNLSNDNDSLYITVNSTYGFQNQSDNIKIWVGTNLDLLPKKPNGLPLQGQFPIRTTVSAGVNEYTFSIAFTEIEAYGGVTACGSLIYIYAHADVIDASSTGQTAWAGTCTSSQSSPGNWYCSTTYQAKCCTTTPPPPPSGYTQTAFAKGGWVFTSDRKSNPENLPSLKLTKNRWGWAINVTEPGETSYAIWAGAGLNYTSKGTLVGTLTVNWDGAFVTVTYNMNPGYSMSGVHVYAGDFKPTTVAPGQYGNIANFDPNALTFTETYAVEDSNADGIWIIAHAGVFGNY